MRKNAAEHPDLNFLQSILSSYAVLQESHFLQESKVWSVQTKPRFRFLNITKFPEQARVFHRKSFVKIFVECFQVNICRVHVTEKFGSCIRKNIARSDRNRTNTRFTAGLRDVHRVFQKNHRIIVSESYAAAAVCICGFGNHFRRSAFGEKVKFSGFADVPVLAKFTGEITSSGTEGQNRRSRQEMIQRFFSIGSMQNPLERP